MAGSAGGARLVREQWQAVLAASEPISVDFTVRARKLAVGSSASRLALEVLDEGGERLGHALVFPEEWYPGCRRRMPYSHYFLALERAFGGLEAQGREPLLRLQVLKAVGARPERPIAILLKLLIAPEFAVTGGRLEGAYQCPLSGFYAHFLGVSRDVRRDASAPAFTVGRAIHRGYQRAARALAATGETEAARRAYLEGVLESWTEDFPHLLLDRPRSATRLYRRPVEAAEAVVERCRALFGAGPPAELYQERLFFAPTRGISGLADRIVGDGRERALYELKTVGGAVERDPLSGREAPGGVQLLAYHEILRALDGRPPRSFVELLDSAALEEIALAEHPVAVRAGVDPADPGDRYVDLLAQARNVSFVVESGLLTGYDRDRIAELGRAVSGPRLRGVGGDFDLYGGAPPCHLCPARERAVCEHARGSGPAPDHDLFRRVPDRLFAYFAWFHGQLKAEENRLKEQLYRLATTPLERLEREEGTCVAGLTLAERRGRAVVLRRTERIETRLREDDRVLLTPEGRAPGEMLSVEGTLRAVGAYELEVDLREEPGDDGSLWRVDQLGHFDRVDWQLQGLTDVLLRSVQETGVRGRKVDESELPALVQLLLGRASPASPGPWSDAGGEAAAGAGWSELNDRQRRAVAAALALPPGGLLLVQGPPGTGKTAMIARLVHELAVAGLWEPAGRRRPVLVLANTHRACNEVVQKLRDRFPDLAPFVVRVGPAGAGMEEAVRGHVLSERLRVRERLAALDLERDGPGELVKLVRLGNLIHDRALVFVGTLAGAARPELRGLEFGTVIVDEAGQATEPATLQALRHLPDGFAGRLVLVGDHRQLPPVVEEGLEAPALPGELAGLGLDAAAGLRRSLFERLVGLHPEALLTLDKQYRMNGPICALVSDVFYAGRLRPASAALAGRGLGEAFAELGVAPALAGPAGRVFGSSAPVVLVDTSADPAARDTVTRLGVEEARDNPREAELVAELVGGLLGSLPPAAARRLAEQVGVISPYRKQNNRIRQELAARTGGLADLVRVDTVDRFQGGEREVIVVSLVASNLAGSLGRLHADPRRLNVAISRARAKLVLVGDRSTFVAPGPVEEQEAKERYRALFDRLDRLAARGEALIVGSERLLEPD